MMHTAERPQVNGAVVAVYPKVIKPEAWQPVAGG
jgi:hypothetical protein